MSEVPCDLVQRFVTDYRLPANDALVLANSAEIAVYFLKVCEFTNYYKAASNWVIGPVKSYINKKNITIEEFPITPEKLAAIITLIDEEKISYTMAYQRLFPNLLNSPEREPFELAVELNLLQQNDRDVITFIVDEVLKEFPLKVEAYKGGKTGVIDMFMGEVMKRSMGRANPVIAFELILKKLDKIKI
jgi:aspartyl-tRNA(Asn)/glutamyl-tRNA(Gln) amidotransferase subunit B